MTLNGQRYRLVPIEDESKPAEEPKPERRPFPGFEIVDHDNDTLRVDEREDAETGCTYASVDVEGSKVYLDPTQLHQLALGALNAARWLKGLDEVSESVEAQCTFSPRRSVLVERSLCSQTGAISFISAGAERIGSHMFGEDTLTAAHRLLQLVVADEAKS
ncbi:MAG: hypothetical protein AAFP15_15755 [Bacteroidota bacterium]